LVVGWDDFLDNGQNSVVQFQAVLGDLGPGSSVTNTASLEWTSLPDDNVSAPFSLSDYNSLATERRYDPATVADVYRVEATAVVRVPRLPETGFAPGRHTPLPERPDGDEYESLPGIRLQIDSIGVDVSIVGVSPAGDGWDLTWLGEEAGWLEGTAFPTWQGNSALTGHVVLPDGRPGPFANLTELAWGDRVVVQGYGQQSVYEVRQVLSVLPEDRYTLRHEERAWLTLITCEAYDPVQDVYLGRRVVRAVLIEVHAGHDSLDLGSGSARRMDPI
jgi:LPXTG-site transpeptidase (sortase) family protein